MGFATVGGMSDLVEKLNFELVELLLETQSTEKGAMKRVHSILQFLSLKWGGQSYDLHIALEPYLKQLKNFCEQVRTQRKNSRMHLLTKLSATSTL